MLGVSSFYNTLKRKSSSNSSSVFGEDKQSPTPNGLKESQKYFVNNSDHNGIGTLHLDEEEDIFDTKGIIREAAINHFDQENENEATPKMEKKASVSQLFSNIKSKFGSTSSRKRVKKTTKSFTSDASYSSRLLWKHNGEWLDRWFNYTDGILAGYKDPTTAKPAEISIDVRTCKLTTLCHRQSIVKDLNLFQLTTPDELSHIFISWNEDQYRSWLECLSLAVELKDELYGLRFEHPTNGFCIEDTGETDIIPYVRSPESESIKVTTSSSSEASGRSGHHGRVDSIDSGNDGDESGLESSLSSSKRMTDIRRAKSEKIDKKIRGPRISEGELVKSKSTSKIDLFRKFSHESTSTDNDVLSPTIEFNGHPLTASLNVPTEIGKKKQRGSFIQKKFGFFDSKSKKDDKVSTPTIDNSKRVNSKSSLSSQSMQSSNMAVSPPKDIETSDNHSYKRPNSLDISSVSTLSTWEGFGGAQTRFKKMSCGSEDDMSSTYSAPSVIDDKVSEDVEDALREETLLRKRRNSLTLERTQIVSKLDVLREADNLITNTINNNLNQQNSSKKHSKVSFSSQPIEKTEELVVDSEKKKAKITLLEEKIDNIDCEIEDIDKRIFNQRVLASDDKQWTQQKHSKPFTKLRLNPKTRALYDMNSQSFESLSSSASRESTISRGDHIDSSSRPPVKNHFIKPKPIQIPKTPDSEDGGHSNSSWNGMEELMITAQRLESTSSNGTEEIKQSSPVGIWRSKSLGSVELLKNKSMRMDINQNNTSASTIIEDFEKFSEMLTNQSKVKQPQQPIDV
ncbi:uncharacterized protein [Clytia hemisphaerica]|uniref:uncharacterized protein isoform X2 n=1 Tax=Clytia hemisphaerica TaxID=252671 RepID=UPI0034D53AA5